MLVHVHHAAVTVACGSAGRSSTNGRDGKLDFDRSGLLELAVQVTSERSEVRAQAAFRILQAKYPNQLGGRQPIIRAAGIYYRALVGPFASAEKAARLCNGLKAIGGDCIIQKN